MTEELKNFTLEDILNDGYLDQVLPAVAGAPGFALPLIERFVNSAWLALFLDRESDLKMYPLDRQVTMNVLSRVALLSVGAFDKAYPHNLTLTEDFKRACYMVSGYLTNQNEQYEMSDECLMDNLNYCLDLLADVHSGVNTL